MGIKIADITMIGELLAFHPGNDRAAFVLSQKMQSGQCIFFLNEDNTATVSYDGIFGGKWAVHLEVKKGVRGNDIKSFCLATLKWKLDNTDLNCILGFVASDNKRLKLFIKGFKGNF